MERAIIMALLNFTPGQPEDDDSGVPHTEGMEGSISGFGPRLGPPIGTIGIDLSYPCPCGNETLNLVRGFDHSLTPEQAGAKFASLWQLVHDEMERHETASKS